MHASSILALVFGAAAVAGAAGCGNVLVVPASTGGGSTVSGTTASSGAGGSGCTAPLAACGASCVDLTSDAAHCGACGHDCEGGACTASVCQPVTLVTTNGYAYGVAVDDTYVYWTESVGNQVLKVPLGGGNPVQLATGDAPTAIAVNATDLYWTDTLSGKLVTMPKAGGQAAALVANQPQLGNLALHDGYAYWLNTGEYTWTGEVNRAPLAGGPAVTLATGKPLWGLSAGGVAVDAVNVYWASNQSVHTVPLGGGATADLVSGTAAAVNDTEVYLCGIYGEVQKLSKVGGPPTTLASASDAHCISGPIVVDAAATYWLASTPTETSVIASLRTVSLAGGAVTTLATLDDAKFIDIAQDATTIYWTTGGTVMKVRKP